MPRRGGVFDKRSDKEAFDEGRRERKSGKQSKGDQFFEKSWDTPADIFFGRDSRTKQEKAYDAGHDSTTREPRTKKGRSSKRESSYGGGSTGGGGGSSSAAGGVIGILVLIAIPIVCVYAYFQGERIGNEWTQNRQQAATVTNKTSVAANGVKVIDRDSNGIGGIMYVDTQVLNVRAGPGDKYPIVRKAYEDEKILVYGQTENVNGQTWSVSIGLDPSTRGWVNMKYLRR